MIFYLSTMIVVKIVKTKKQGSCMPKEFSDFHENAISSSEERIVLSTEESAQALSLISNYCQNQYQVFKQQSTNFFKSNGDSLGKYLFNSIRLTHHDNDSIITYMKKAGYNKVVSLVEANFNLLERGARNLVAEIPERTLSALDPYNLMICAMSTADVKKYFMQRFDQITTPIQYYQDFSGTWNRRSNSLNYSFQNAYDNFSQIDGSLTNPGKKITHSGEIIYDLTNRFVAEKLGIFLSVFGLFCLPPFRARTNMAMNHLFPKTRLYGKVAQQFPVRLLVTKKIAKLYGNPILSIMVGTYLIGMHVGQHLKDSYELKQKNPKLFERLQLMNREFSDASSHLELLESAKRTSMKNQK